MGKMEIEMPASIKFQLDAASPLDFRLTTPTTSGHFVRSAIVKTYGSR